LPERPALGWVGRDIVWQGRHIKRAETFVGIILALRTAGIDVDAYMYGPAFGVGNISNYAAACDATLFDGGRGKSLEEFYHRLDALVVTCEPEPGPLTIYEALRCGVEVVSVETGAAKVAGLDIYADEELDAACYARLKHREEYHRLRHQLRSRVEDLTQERWARFSIELAAGVAKGGIN
jgi:glycosyltransferase involved in cell wall biosynthesis